MKKSKIFLLLIFLLALNVAYAQSHTWDGGAGNNLWSSANNWNPNSVPGVGSFVRIDGGATVELDVDKTIAGIIFLGTAGSAGQLTINTGITLTATARGIRIFNAGSNLIINGTYTATSFTASQSGIRNTDGGGDITIGMNGTVAISNVISGYGIFSSSGTIVNNGTITLSSISANEGISITGGTMTNNGSISIATSISNLFAIRGPITNAGSGMIIGNSANLNAVINSDVTFTGGTISPGMSIGQLSFRSGFAPTGSMSYPVEIAKSGASLTSDVLYFFNGATANFNITNLNVVVSDIGVDALAEGDIFTIISAPGGVGYTGAAFASIDLSGPTLPAGKEWTVNYNADGVTIEVTAILPVKFTYFNANQKEENVNLNWQTATEINNEGFEIQRSADGRKWEEISFVEGMGTNNQSTNYTYTDTHPANGANYYRLKQVDYDGKFDFSNIEMVYLGEGSDINVFPNPSSSGIFYINNATVKNETSVKVFSTLGEEIIEVLLNGNQIDLSTLLPGVYYLEIGNVSKQVIIN